MKKGEIMARPKKEKELSRSHLIAFRLTDAEYDLLAGMAKESGLSTSAYIRETLLDGKSTVTNEETDDAPELQRLTAEFRKIGNSLNQIARYFHMGVIRSRAMQDEMQEYVSQISDMQREPADMADEPPGSVETYHGQKR